MKIYKRRAEALVQLGLVFSYPLLLYDIDLSSSSLLPIGRRNCVIIDSLMICPL